MRHKTGAFAGPDNARSLGEPMSTASLIVCLNDHSVRPLAGEVISRFARGVPPVWLSEFGSKRDLRLQIENALGNGARFLFLSLDRYAISGASLIFDLKGYALRHAVVKGIPFGIHVDLRRVLHQPPLDDEKIRAGVVLIALEEAGGEDEACALFPNLAHFVHTPGMTQEALNSIVSRIRELTR